MTIPIWLKIVTMNPGKELDALVAEKVMGYELKHLKEGYIFNGKKQKLDGCFHLKGPNGGFMAEFLAVRRYNPYDGKELEGYPWCIAYSYIPPYSTEIASAWEVVSKMNWEYFQLRRIKNPRNRVKPKVYWWCANYEEDEQECEEWAVDEIGLTAPHAICLAALRACGVDLEGDEDE